MASTGNSVLSDQITASGPKIITNIANTKIDKIVMISFVCFVINLLDVQGGAEAPMIA